MTTVLCTLYNSLYLDKGLVLYDSLCECAEDFKLYVLCMDDKCYEVLKELHQEHHIPIRLSDLEEGDRDLLKAKGNRPVGEYCWACSSSFIRYVLNYYHEPICTYIDADMYFYHDPRVLIDEMINAGKSVMIIPHRFPKSTEAKSQKVGKYCVEFNTFINSPESLEVLEYWRNRCLECCSNLGDGVHWGDQKYLEELEHKYECVHVCQNNGAGVAPWNIMLYEKPTSDILGNVIWKDSSSEISLIFYHFQSVEYITRQLINTNISTLPNIDISLVDMLYYTYLHKIEAKKQFLEKKYGINYLITHHPADKKIPIYKLLFRKINPKRILSNVKSLLSGIHSYTIYIENHV